MDLLVLILQGVIVSATSLVFAAIGELVVERAGVLNLGLEGMMVLGAIAGFAVTLDTGSYVVGIAAAADKTQRFNLTVQQPCKRIVTNPRIVSINF